MGVRGATWAFVCSSKHNAMGTQEPSVNKYWQQILKTSELYKGLMQALIIVDKQFYKVTDLRSKS